MYKVLLSNRGNPDHQQDPARPVYGAPRDKWVNVPSIEQAVLLCRTYIREFELGFGNWTGGAVVQTPEPGVIKGVFVAGIIAYNGRFFPIDHPDGYGKPNRVAARAIAKLTKGSTGDPPVPAGDPPAAQNRPAFPPTAPAK